MKEFEPEGDDIDRMAEIDPAIWELLREMSCDEMLELADKLEGSALKLESLIQDVAFPPFVPLPVVLHEPYSEAIRQVVFGLN